MSESSPHINGGLLSKAIKLDVPTESAQHRRKEVMLEKLLQNTKPPKTYKLPTSTLLSKVKEFLPQIKQANKKLEIMNNEEIVVDNVSETEESYVEMNLAIYTDSEDSDTETEEITNTRKSLEPSSVQNTSIISKLVELVQTNDL